MYKSNTTGNLEANHLRKDAGIGDNHKYNSTSLALQLHPNNKKTETLKLGTFGLEKSVGIACLAVRQCYTSKKK